MDRGENEEQFWNKAFQSRPYREVLLTEKIAPLWLLNGLDEKIFVTGKSIEILSKLDKNIDKERGRAISLYTDLFTEFIKKLNSQLGKSEVDSLSENYEKHDSLDSEF